MKIFYFTKPFLLDSDIPLIREYQRKGHEVLVLIDLPYYFLRSTLIDIKQQINELRIIKAIEYKEFRQFSSYLNIEEIYFLNRPVASSINYKNIALYFKTLQFIRNFNPDIFHVTFVFQSLEVLFYFFKRKLVLTVHDPFLHTGEYSLRRELFRLLAFRVCNNLVLLNSIQLYEFKVKYKLNDKSILINKLGVYDCIKIFAADRRIKVDQNVVLFFGRISKYKGVKYLLDAMKEVNCILPEAKLVIAGGGKFDFDVSEYKSFDFIDIRNYYITMSELSELIHMSKVVICPYIDATQSGVILTAYAMNKPVIVTDVGSLSQMLANGKTGLLIQPREISQIVKSIIEILVDDEFHKILAANIRNFVKLNDLDWSVIADKYIDFYSQIN